jgi:hypothetical protein
MSTCAATHSYVLCALPVCARPMAAAAAPFRRFEQNKSTAARTLWPCTGETHPTPAQSAWRGWAQGRAALCGVGLSVHAHADRQLACRLRLLRSVPAGAHPASCAAGCSPLCPSDARKGVRPVSV